jgi:hypothetical protein
MGFFMNETESRHYMVFGCIAGTYIKRILVREKLMMRVPLCGLQNFYDNHYIQRLGMIGYYTVRSGRF